MKGTSKNRFFCFSAASSCGFCSSHVPKEYTPFTKTLLSLPKKQNSSVFRGTLNLPYSDNKKIKLTNPVILATKNQGKIAELTVMLKKLNITVVGLKAYPDLPEIEENGTSFMENALIKARTVAEFTKLTAIADDSGLCVTALNDDPGIYSARYYQNSKKEIQKKDDLCRQNKEQETEKSNDQKNIDLLLENMKNVPQEKRQVCFHCAAAICNPDGQEFCVQGVWKGYLAFEAKGKNGFGYDPIFIDPETNKHAAELSPEQKNLKSHRYNAFTKLMAMLGKH